MSRAPVRTFRNGQWLWSWQRGRLYVGVIIRVTHYEQYENDPFITIDAVAIPPDSSLYTPARAYAHYSGGDTHCMMDGGRSTQLPHWYASRRAALAVGRADVAARLAAVRGELTELERELAAYDAALGASSLTKSNGARRLTIPGV